MRKNIFYIFALCSLLCFSCEDNLSPMPDAEQYGTWTDPRDGQQYPWVQYGTQQWMTQNFAYHIVGDTLYGDEDATAQERAENLARFGRLYTHQQAQNIVPTTDGWRLPTDADFQTLERHVGMTASEANAWDWRGSVAERIFSMGTVRQVPLNFLLAGYYTDHTIMGTTGFRFSDVQGYYWTATRDTQKEGEYYIYRRLMYNQSGIYRQSMEPTAQMLSVRLVRDAQ